jgi:GH24 family phage-related lysozyme (muramidase)
MVEVTIPVINAISKASLGTVTKTAYTDGTGKFTDGTGATAQVQGLAYALAC